MPFINLKYIRYMKNYLREKEYNLDVLVTSYKEEMVEPFNSFYSKGAIKNIEKAIKKNDRQINSLYKGIRTEYIPEAIARKYSSDWKMFANINTKEDIEKYKIHII